MTATRSNRQQRTTTAFTVICWLTVIHTAKAWISDNPRPLVSQASHITRRSPIANSPISFQQQQTKHSAAASTTTILQQSPSDATEVEANINGESPGGGGGSSRIIPAAMTGKSQLAAAFTALDETDQYDAVLTGLCAKILDNSQEEATTLQDPASLLTEMNDRRISASPRSLMALIDATVKNQDALTMSDMISLAIRNPNGLKQYGILQSSILGIPANPTQRVVCPDGSRKTKAERLAALPDVPKDDRASEVASAMTILGVMGVCFLTSFFHMDDITPLTNIIWWSIIIVGVVDNFYDVLKMGSNVAISSLNTTDTNKENLKIPNKDDLPFGLGSGKLTGTVVQGLTRLLSVDTERECQAEAAALYAAYVLGLPCFAFRPNSLEAAYLIAQSISANDSASSKRTNKNLDPLLSNEGILKVLVWLMAPVAMESMKHPQLICSDPREASGLLQRLEDNSGKNNIDASQLWWLAEDDPDQEKADLLKWAYHEADILLRNNMRTVTEISERLTGGAATIGDCVAAIENW